MRGDPLGRLALIVIVLVLFYDTIFAVVSFATETFTGAFESIYETVENEIVETGGGEPLFPTTEKFLRDLFTWQAFIFTNAMGLAILLFIDLVKMAYRA